MEVSRRRWDMRLHQWMELSDKQYEPHNLCRHFWGTFFLLVFLGIAGIIMAVISPILGVYWVGKRLNAWWLKRHPPKDPKPAKPPGLVSSWMQAKHDGVCPTITLTD